jgi:hypothetical protein
MNQKIYDCMTKLQKLEFSPVETLSQLRCCPDYSIMFFSWGVNDIGVLAGTKQQAKSLCFRVRGRLFKGWVHIALNFDDTYIISFISTQGNIKETLENVYCDELTEKIDEFVETPKKSIRSLYN